MASHEGHGRRSEGPAVLHVIDSDGPGGAESIVVALVTHAAADSLRSEVITPGTGPWLTSALRQSGVRVVPVPNSWPVVRAFDATYLDGLRRAIRGSRPEVVHAHSHGVGFYVALALLLCRSRVPLVVTFHGTTDLALHVRFQWLKWRLLRRAAAVVCVSEALANQARATPGVRAERVLCIHNGIDIAHFAPRRNDSLRRVRGIGPDVVMVGALGNVRPAKGYEVLVRAIAQCIACGLRVRLLIAGDDRNPLAEELRSLAEALGLDDSIEFVGFVDDAATFLNGLDLLVVSSHTEGFSLAAAQAQACGLAVISTRCGGPEEILEDGVTGVLVPPGDADALHRAIRSLVGDSAARDRMGTAGRLRAVDRFSGEAMVLGYRDVYRAVMKPGATAGST